METEEIFASFLEAIGSLKAFHHHWIGTAKEAAVIMCEPDGKDKEFGFFWEGDLYEIEVKAKGCGYLKPLVWKVVGSSREPLVWEA